MIFDFINLGAQIRSNREQRKTERVSRRIQEIKAARERRRQVAFALKERANVVSGAQASGTGSTSGAVAGAGSAITQAGANTGFITSVQAGATRISEGQQKMRNLQTVSAVSSSLSDMQNQAVNLFGS